MKYGMQGIGIFWCLVEMLYEQEGFILIEYERIAFELRIDSNVLEWIINESGLFIVKDKFFYSETVLQRLKKRNNKSAKARESITKRWEKSKINTNVLPSNYEGNTIKESKVKENKVNSIINSEKFNFKKSLIELGVDEKIVDDWIIVRKQKKAANTETAYKAIEKQILVSGYNATDCIRIAVEKSWSGFKAEWLNNLMQNQNGTNRQHPKEGTTWTELAEVVRNAFPGQV